MSALLALSGVACTTKTTILKRLREFDDSIVIHLEDYKELYDRFAYDNRVGGMLFAAYRSKNDEFHKNDYKKVHVFDRQPMEALVYHTIYQEMDKKSMCEAFRVCRNMGLCDGWQSIVFKTPVETDFKIVDMMKKRDNKIDTQSVDYVRRQNDAFETWCDSMNYDSVQMNVVGNIDEQQRFVIDTIINKIYNWTYYNIDGLAVYRYRLPLLRYKMAIFNLDTIITTKTNHLESQSVVSWQLKRVNIKERFEALLNENYTIVLITDHLTSDIDKHQRKFKYICNIIKIPLIVIASFKMNNYRTPQIGKFEYLLRKQSMINLNNSFYCGLDNELDTQFANNCCIKFYHENNYFNN